MKLEMGRKNAKVAGKFLTAKNVVFDSNGGEINPKFRGGKKI